MPGVGLTRLKMNHILLKPKNRPKKRGYYLRLAYGYMHPMLVSVMPKLSGRGFDVCSESLLHPLSKEPRSTRWSDEVTFNKPEWAKLPYEWRNDPGAK
jgi:hypothetical protein